MDLESPHLSSGGQLPTHVTEKARGCYGVRDTLRYGFASAKEEVAPAHPLEQSVANYGASQEALRMQVLRSTQGRHMPLRLQMERSIVSKIQRMPPLESSMIALETLTGMDTCLSAEDIFRSPSEAFATVDTHLAMQHKIKMN